jgi:prefoldin subunit 4
LEFHHNPATDRRAQLSKEDEQASEEVEVRREDQDKINKFSRLHQRELAMEEELKLKNVSDAKIQTSKLTLRLRQANG